MNASPISATDPDWWAALNSQLKMHPGVAERLIIEITETAAIQDIDDTRGFVARVKDLGCQIAIDDFGAGYTSFRNLQRLKVDTVKIDGSYIENLKANPENQVFVRTLVGLAQNLDMKTVAEWVSSDEDAALLESMGVDYFQGFHFGSPVLDPSWAK